ncbi:hypothetical protein BSL78_25019 [Apostichopus japonicus]|uniref:RNA-directed DNA polymerase from mobile element jockey-like n=1 Tax=Stichopus japonicus TaxID=307972 RepID=A0A2G8JQT7_STIJA|nr:hypothetical protein BSL78_25019 [Apostichopus japonicus]
MKHHVKNTASAASFALYKIGQLAKYLDHKSTERLVHAFITSRLDYCNSLLYGIPSTELSKLQLIQNSAARLVTRSKKHDHITPILRDLHWLPLHLRIRYKVALLAFKAIHGMAPSYLTDLVASYSPQRRLRSSSETLLCRPRRCNTRFYGDRCFSAAAPEVWNNLPWDLREAPHLNRFKKDLKTYLFSCF